MKEAGYKNCQSCGMPLSRDSQGGGSNADGSRSRMYCSHCFVDGKFTLPDVTLEQMQGRVRDKLREMGFRKIPRLARWNGESA